MSENRNEIAARLRGALTRRASGRVCRGALKLEPGPCSHRGGPRPAHGAAAAIGTLFGIEGSAILTGGDSHARSSRSPAAARAPWWAPQGYRTTSIWRRASTARMGPSRHGRPKLASPSVSARMPEGLTWSSAALELDQQQPPHPRGGDSVYFDPPHGMRPRHQSALPSHHHRLSRYRRPTRPLL